MRTISEMATRLDVPWCGGGCGLSKTKHREGCLFLGVVHFADRRFTRRAARNLLLLVARMKRESDDQYLNHEVYDWWSLSRCRDCGEDGDGVRRPAAGLGVRP